MIQRFVIEEFLKGLTAKLAEEAWIGANDEAALNEAAGHGAIIDFVQDWLQEYKGEL